MVTGSAWLDVFKKGGDSLMGRNYYYRLHPFSLAELLKSPKKWDVMSPLDIPVQNLQQQEYLKLLDRFGGFPEPLLKQNERTLRRWHQMRLERITREDIRDLEAREVDCLVTIDQKPWFAVEVKTSSRNISLSLHYFIKRMDIPFAFQVVQEDGIEYMKNNIRVISASRFLAALVSGLNRIETRRRLNCASDVH